MKEARCEDSFALAAALAAILAAPVTARVDAQPAADLIVTGARVVTLDAARPEAHAVAMLNGRIVRVGTDAEALAWRGAKTNVVDAKGKLLVPGFNDAHVHFRSGGAQLDSVELRDAATPGEFARRIGDRAKARPGQWITGGDWDHEQWSPAALPTKELVDGATRETPVFVTRTDGHMGLANSAALKLAGVDARSADPPGGTIVRGKDGEPTGVLKDAAMNAVFAVIPAPTRTERRRQLERALEHAASLGVTSVQDMGMDAEDVGVLSELEESGKLTARVYVARPIAFADAVVKSGLSRAFGSQWLRLGALKGYADGSLGSTTAHFFEPYLDAPDTAGLLAEDMQPPSRMRERMLQADAAGVQLCIHAIGDRAISMILDLFEEVVKANGPRDRRLRIEHAQHVAPKDFERFAKLSVVASMQPTHCIDDGRWAEKRIGAERAKTTYAFRTFLDRRVTLAFGTDWNVASLDPLLSIYSAVTRRTEDGKHPGGWVPEQKISVKEALEAYTLGSAYAEHREKDKGSLSEGKLADMALLSEDIFRIAPERIRDVKVECTIVNGRVVYTRTRPHTYTTATGH